MEIGPKDKEMVREVSQSGLSGKCSLPQAHVQRRQILSDSLISCIAVCRRPLYALGRCGTKEAGLEVTQ